MVGEGIIEDLDIEDAQGVGDQNVIQAALGLPAWEGLELAIQAAQVGLPHQLPQGPATACLLYTSPSPRDRTRSRMPSSA